MPSEERASVDIPVRRRDWVQRWLSDELFWRGIFSNVLSGAGVALIAYLGAYAAGFVTTAQFTPVVTFSMRAGLLLISVLYMIRTIARLETFSGVWKMTHLLLASAIFCSIWFVPGSQLSELVVDFLRN